MKKVFFLLLMICCGMLFGCNNQKDTTQNMSHNQFSNTNETRKKVETVINNIDELLEISSKEIQKTQENALLVTYLCQNKTFSEDKCLGIQDKLSQIEGTLKEEYLKYQTVKDGFHEPKFWDFALKDLSTDQGVINILEDDLINLYKSYYVIMFGTCDEKCENDLENRIYMKQYILSMFNV